MFVLPSLIKILILTTKICLIQSNTSRAAADDDSYGSTINNNTNSKQLNLKQQETSGNTDYAVVVDCGSSGSRAHIFKWSLSNSTQQQQQIKVEPARDEKTNEKLIFSIKPGLSSLRNQPERASNYMKPIMEYLNSMIPDEYHETTPIYFMGTAGMRLLPLDEQEKILFDLKRDFELEYDFKEIQAEVISGSKEGYYQWLSVNSDRNRLTSEFNITRKSIHCLAPKLRRFSLIELGGASAQIAFELSSQLEKMITSNLDPEAQLAFRSFISDVSIGGTNQDHDHLLTTKVFSTTFLGFGTTNARELAVDLLVREALQISLGDIYGPPAHHFVTGSTLNIHDACLPRNSEQIFKKPLDLIRNPSKTLGYQVAQTSGENEATFSVRLIGRGNYRKCRQLLDRLIMLVKQEHLNCQFENNKSGGDSEKETEALTCSTSLINTNFVPFKYFQFLGLSELYYTTKEMIQAEGLFNQNLILKRTMQICSSDYEYLLGKFPDSNRIDKDRILLECFKASWMLALLQTGFKMSPNYQTDFQTIDDDNDWTLGGLIAKLISQQRQVQHEIDR